MKRKPPKPGISILAMVIGLSLALLCATVFIALLRALFGI
jgi:hypothetical protein